MYFAEQSDPLANAGERQSNASQEKPAPSDDAGACTHCERHEPTLPSCSRCGLVK